MCQITESNFQNHNFNYRRPTSIGPGSAQFHIAFSDDSNSSTDPLASKNFKYLHTDTSIDITEHHLYDASKEIQQQSSTNIINNVTQKLPEIEMEIVSPVATAKILKLDSVELRKKYNIGSEISILKNDALAKKPFSVLTYLKENNINSNALSCKIKLEVLSTNYVKKNTNNRYSLAELKAATTSYYFNKLQQYLTCNYCTKTFSTRFGMQMHEESHSQTKPFKCSRCKEQFLCKSGLRRHLINSHGLSPIIREARPLISESKLDSGAEKQKSEVDTIQISDQTTLIILKPDQNGKSEKKSLTELNGNNQVSIIPKAPNQTTESKSENREKSKSESQEKSKSLSSISSKQLSNVTKENIIKSNIRKNKVEIKKSTGSKENFKYVSKSINKKPNLLAVRYNKCELCNKVFRNPIQYKNHLNFFHTTKPLEESCKVKTVEKVEPEEDDDDNRNYGLRVRTTQPSYATPFRCNICDKKLTDENTLNLHMYCHIPVVFSYESVSMAEDGPEVFICYLCDKGFPRERYLKLHNLQVHLCKTTMCKICRREFKSEFWFNRHKCQLNEEVPTPSHEEKMPLSCKLCNRYFAKVRFMKSHCRRMHPGIKLNDLILYNPNYKSDDINVTNLDLNDPMKLYDIPDNDKKTLKETSDLEGASDENSNDCNNTEDREVERLIFTPGNTKDDTVDKSRCNSSLTKTSIITFPTRRKSIQRSIPKIQCDFCGDYIEENRYDNHIYEHNKIRFTKMSRKNEENTSLEDLDKNKVILNCSICSKAFQRKYYLMCHLNRHLQEEPHLTDVVLAAQMALEDDKTDSESEEDEEEDREGREEEPHEINLRIANTSDIYKCCDKTFKLKAHFFRHYKIKHGAYKIPSPGRISRMGKIKKEYIEPTEEDSQTSFVASTPIKEEKDDETPIENDTCSVTNKRKSEELSENEDLPETTEPLESTCKKIKSEFPSSPQEEGYFDQQPIFNFKYQCPTCTKSFRQKCQLRDHSNVHTGAKPYICEFCVPSRGFTQTSSLYVHFRRVHAAIVKNCVWENYSKNGACLICSALFEKHAVMFQHLKDHYMKKTFNCHVCMSECNMVCHYKVHDINPEEMRLILQANASDSDEDEEDTESNFEREIDNTEIENETKGTLFEERVESDEEAPYSRKYIYCTYCHKSFKSPQQFKFHKKSLAHIQKVQLLKKQKNAEKENSLDNLNDIKNNVQAMMKKLNNIQQKKYKCDVCNKTFLRKVHLKKHKRKTHKCKSKNGNGNFVSEMDEMSEYADSEFPDTDVDQMNEDMFDNSDQDFIGEAHNVCSTSKFTNIDGSLNLPDGWESLNDPHKEYLDTCDDEDSDGEIKDISSFLSVDMIELDRTSELHEAIGSNDENASDLDKSIEPHKITDSNNENHPDINVNKNENVPVLSPNILNSSDASDKEVTVSSSNLLESSDVTHKDATRSSPNLLNTSDVTDKDVTMSSPNLLNTLDAIGKDVTVSCPNVLNSSDVIDKDVTMSSPNLLESLDVTDKDVTMSSPNLLNPSDAIGTDVTVSSPNLLNTSDAIGTDVTVSSPNLLNPSGVIDKDVTMSSPNLLDVTRKDVTMLSSNLLNSLDVIDKDVTVSSTDLNSSDVDKNVSVFSPNILNSSDVTDKDVTMTSPKLLNSSDVIETSTYNDLDNDQENNISEIGTEGNCTNEPTLGNSMSNIESPESTYM